MKDKPWYPVVYMFAVTAVFSSVIIGFAGYTSDLVNANKQLAFERAVLDVFNLAGGKTSVQLHETFINRIKFTDSSGDCPCLLMDDGEIAGYAIPVSGKGFWAEIKGIVGIALDGRTITGIAFYEQNETPGLGAEIVTPAFRDQFINKTMAPSGEPIGIRPFGSQLAGNEVHAITGATQTCRRLEKLINDDLAKWRDSREGGPGS